MRKPTKRSLPAKLYFMIVGDPNRPLYLKIHSKVPIVALLTAVIIGTTASESAREIIYSGSPDGVRIARIESSSQLANTAFLMLGVGVFSAYLLAAVDRLAITHHHQKSINDPSNDQEI